MGSVSGNEGVAAIVDEGEHLVEIAFEIVEENAADAARLLAMGQEEILVAPFLEARVIGDADAACRHRARCGENGSTSSLKG